MILNIRGTSGSGKSTLVRRIMDTYPERQAITQDGRKRPIGYVLRRPGADRDLGVIGHYEIDCGGCDTIRTVPEVYAQVSEHLRHGRHVLYEGIMVADDVKHLVAFQHDLISTPIQIILLSTSLSDCLAAVQGRRDARARAQGKAPEPLDPKNTTNRVKSHYSACKRLRAAGIPVEELDREAAFQRAQELLT